jgi:hypothetical protein
MEIKVKGSIRRFTVTDKGLDLTLRVPHGQLTGEVLKAFEFVAGSVKPDDQITVQFKANDNLFVKEE